MITPEDKQHLVELLETGQKFEAIQYVNQHLGVNLEQATILVEALENEVIPKARINIRNINPGILVGRIFAGLGLVFLIVVFILVWNDRKSTSHCTKVTGKVERLEYNNEGGSVPIIQYRYTGKERQYKGSVWSTPPSYEEGEEVELLINENNPGEVTVNTFLERYFLIAFFSGFAIVFGGVGLLVLRFLGK